MTKIFNAIRGMNDILPREMAYWHCLEQQLRQIVESAGYQEIRFPIVEQTDLFKRTIGDVTDIVEKEMYTFTDRNGDSLSLRPEGTAGCVRAAIEHGLLYNQIQRLWYLGPMFRHERPQLGRYRQFYQFGLEAFGIATPDIDAEIIQLGARLWRNLGLQEHVQLQINTLGTIAERQQYRQALVDYLTQHTDQLDADSQRRLHSNPLRILDSKDEHTQTLLTAAPQLTDYLGAESKQHFARLLALLAHAGIDYQHNQRLVRGLDYYGGPVFEWVTAQLGAQGTVCAGGRYDTLVEKLGGQATPAVGFALGIERVAALLAQTRELHQPIHAYLVAMGEAARAQALLLAEQWRQALPGLRLQVNGDDASFKTQFKRADKSGAAIALILGDNELRQEQVAVKWLRQDSAQIDIAFAGLVSYLQQFL